VVELTTTTQEEDLVMAAEGGAAVFIGIGLAFEYAEWIELAADVLCLLDGGCGSPWVHSLMQFAMFFFVAGVSNLRLWKKSDVALSIR